MNQNQEYSPSALRPSISACFMDRQPSIILSDDQMLPQKSDSQASLRNQLQQLQILDQDKSVEELIYDLKSDLDPESLKESVNDLQERTSYELKSMPSAQSLGLAYRKSSALSLATRAYQARRSFASREDFRMSDGSHGESAWNLLTPNKPVNSRTTSMGNPEHERAKNNMQQASVANDSFSSNQTRPSQDPLQGRDRSPAFAAQGALSLADNQEVSPAPVTRFAPRTLSNNIGNNRVTLPFRRQNTFGPDSCRPGLSMAQANATSKIFKYSSKNDSKLNVSLQRLMNAHTTGISGLFKTTEPTNIPLQRSTSQRDQQKTQRASSLLEQVSNISSDAQGGEPHRVVPQLSADFIPAFSHFDQKPAHRTHQEDDSLKNVLQSIKQIQNGTQDLEIRKMQTSENQTMPSERQSNSKATPMFGKDLRSQFMVTPFISGNRSGSSVRSPTGQAEAVSEFKSNLTSSFKLHAPQPAENLKSTDQDLKIMSKAKTPIPSTDRTHIPIKVSSCILSSQQPTQAMQLRGGGALAPSFGTSLFRPLYSRVQSNSSWDVKSLPGPKSSHSGSNFQQTRKRDSKLLVKQQKSLTHAMGLSQDSESVLSQRHMVSQFEMAASEDSYKHNNTYLAQNQFDSSFENLRCDGRSNQIQGFQAAGDSGLIASPDKVKLARTTKQQMTSQNQALNERSRVSSHLIMQNKKQPAGALSTGQLRLRAGPPRLQPSIAPKSSPNIKSPPQESQQYARGQLSLAQLNSVTSMKDVGGSGQDLRQTLAQPDATMKAQPSIPVGNDCIILPHASQVSFNKRTHASTLYKAMAAKQRLEELERHSMKQPGQVSKRAKLTADPYQTLAGCNTGVSAAAADYILPGPGGGLNFSTQTQNQSAMLQIQPFQASVSPVLENSFTQAVNLTSSDINMEDNTIASMDLTQNHYQRSAVEHSQYVTPAMQGQQRPGHPQLAVQAHKPCNCRKSRCLKLYCECFANNRFCGPACACVCCNNSAQFDAQRLQAKQQILMRNPQAFRHNKLVEQHMADSASESQSQQESLALKSQASSVVADAKKHFKGCNCRKTRCQKNYCECFQAGVPCSDLCTCDGCQNGDDKTPHNHHHQPPQQMAFNHKENVKGSENSRVLFAKSQTQADRVQMANQAIEMIDNLDCLQPERRDYLKPVSRILASIGPTTARTSSAQQDEENKTNGRKKLHTSSSSESNQPLGARPLRH